MKPVHRILVAIKDPCALSSPALAKAAQLAEAFGAELQLFHAITTPLYVDCYGIDDRSPAQVERETREQAVERLEIIAASLRRNGLKVTTAAEWDFPAHESILRQAGRFEADLIIAEPHAGHRIAPLILHLTDWELLRLSPVPVLLVKTPGTYRRPVILAAVDPSHAYAKPSSLDNEILSAAGAIQQALDGELHAVHAFVPVPVGLLDVEPRAARRMEREGIEIARARLDRALRTTDISLSRRHLEINSPDEAIRDVAKQTRAAVVVMGAVSRSGLKRLFIGNTAEHTLDALDCDVLVVKPPVFAIRMSSRPRGARHGVIGPMLPI
jgi:universal stress protein E